MAREEAEIKELTKKLEQNPDSMVFVQLADAWRRMGNLEQCIEVCQKGLERHPTYTTARTILGRAYMDMGKLDEAAAEFKKIEVADPDNIVAHRMLGQIYMKKGLYGEAIARHQKVLSLDPDDHAVQELLQEALLKAKQGSQAPAGEGAASAAEAAAPAKAFSAEQLSTIRVAEIYMKKGAWDEAVEVLNEILASDPHNALAHQKLREIAQRRGGVGSAAEEAKRKAEEEARRRAEEEAKRKAEEEARRRAEEEARRKAEEEARRRAEEEARREAEERKRNKLSSEDILSVMAADDELIAEEAPAGADKTAADAPAPAGLDPKVAEHVAAFARNNGIEAHLMLTRDGALLHSAMPGSADLKALSAAAYGIFSNTEKAAQRMRFGALQQVIVSAEGGRQVLFVSLQAGVLVALTGKSTNLGLLRIAINDLMKKA